VAKDVKYSQPIHRKYVYKINQHIINQHSRIVIEDYFLINVKKTVVYTRVNGE